MLTCATLRYHESHFVTIIFTMLFYPRHCSNLTFVVQRRRLTAAVTSRHSSKPLDGGSILLSRCLRFLALLSATAIAEELLVPFFKQACNHRIIAS
jgi:hypothetical protein